MPEQQMHILLESRPFYPSVGGMETVARQLAEVWHGQGHTVPVVTQTPLSDAEPLDTLDVMRQPSLATWWQLLRDADIFVQSGISLKSLPLGLLSDTPVVFIHHNMLPMGSGTVGIRNQLKRWAAHMGTNIAVSSAVAQDLPSSRTTVIHNPFEPYFTSIEVPADPHHLLFVGRLVSVKGADVALHALSQLDASYTLTICGDGPERSDLEQLSTTLGLSDRVTFEGWVDHDELCTHAQRASIQLVPSRYEPFGIVALEAIAAGCAVVASDTGGLSEAVGPCGILVPPDDPAALARGIKRAASTGEDMLASRDEHLAQFDIDVIAEQYLEVFRRVMG
jgi:glycosyltransferase involved in cell wall biosynthesis